MTFITGAEYVTNSPTFWRHIKILAQKSDELQYEVMDDPDIGTLYGGVILRNSLYIMKLGMYHIASPMINNKYDILRQMLDES